MSVAETGWFGEWWRRKKGKPIPSHVTFFHCFGGLSFSLIILQLVTGVFMLFYYTPEPDKALYSIEQMSNEVTLGWLFRNLHRWSSTILLATVFSHMVIVFFYKAYRSPREFTWISGVLQLFLVFLLVVTGIMLPWDWRAYWSFAIWMDYIETWAVLGEPLKNILLDTFSLKVVYWAHILGIPLLLAGMLFFHFKMVRRHGISEPL
ncbi:MAG: hypothetical protein GY731_13015 [Gammaproteobacteria bacterium]|nr:hypothetical protein [Gammaproteobacteria bacterium]